MGELAASYSLFSSSLRKSITGYNPDSLINSKGYAIIDKMRTDETVKASLTFKKQSVTAPGWFIDPASDDPKDEEIAEFVEYALDHMHGSVTESITQILLALDYGFSVTEIIWKMYDSGEHQGKIGLKALKSKRPAFYDFETDEFGNLLKKGLINKGTVSGSQPLPIDKFLIYSYQKEFGNWYGSSDLRQAYRSWWSKDNIIKFWNIYLEKFGMPTVWGQHQTSDPTKVAAFQDILNKIQTSTNITGPKGEYDIELLEATRGGDGSYEKAVAYHDRGIAKSILMPDDVTEAKGGEGSNARAKSRLDVFFIIIDKLRQDIEEIVIQEQLIRRLVSFNFSDVTSLPKFKFRPLTHAQKLELAANWSDLVQKGAVSPSFKDENHVRDMVGFPEKDEAEFKAEQDQKAQVAMKGVEASDPEKKEEKSKAKSGADKKEIEEKKMSKEYVERDKTRFEKQVNFQQIEKRLNADEIKIVKTLQVSLAKQRDSVISFATNKMKKNELNTKNVFNLDLKFKGEIKKTINGMFEALYNQGKEDGRKELPKNFATTGKQGIEVAPEAALSFLQDKTDFVVKGINEPLLGDIQKELLNAIERGRSIPNTVKALTEAYAPYLNDGTVIVDDKQQEPYRLEAITRTNMNQAYNQGRRAIGEDPDLEGFVLGYQFSEIMDSRTVAVSRFADGKTIRIGDPLLPGLTYSLHWQERGIFVYITKDMEPIEWTSDSELAQLSVMVNGAKGTKP